MIELKKYYVYATMKVRVTIDAVSAEAAQSELERHLSGQAGIWLRSDDPQDTTVHLAEVHGVTEAED